MFNHSIRVYADTSVFGGVFDDEYAATSAAFFEKVKSGAFSLVVSATLEREIGDAPNHVLDLYRDIRREADVIEEQDRIDLLCEAYIRHGIVTPKWEADALHVASAAVSECKLIVSWNFRHIVNFHRIQLYNAVNMLLGYRPLAIHTPAEVVSDEL